MMDIRWMGWASCRGHDPDWWHPAGDENYTRWPQRRALQICETCPVQRECADYAESFERGFYRFGLWGGLTPKQRGRRKKTKETARG